VSYGSHPRNVLDFWKAESDKPTPVVIFIHGGGFRNGDKSKIQNPANFGQVKKCLENGVSFASINYRFVVDARLDEIILDCARAVQFLRSKAKEWNIDKTKVAAYGGSAGAGTSLWLATHDDLADPDNNDQVLRESTRLVAAALNGTQATYDFDKWSEVLELDENQVEQFYTGQDLQSYRISSKADYSREEIIELRKFLDMPSFIDPEDPPILLTCNIEEGPITDKGSFLHHPDHSIYVKKVLDENDVPNRIVLKSTPKEERISAIDFLLKHLIEDL